MILAEEGALFRAPRSILAGILIAAMALFTFIGPVAPARADSATVTTAEDLEDALGRSTDQIALGNPIIVTDGALTVQSNTTLILNGHSLETVGITVNPGFTLTIGVPGNDGHLEARGDGRPGIRSTGATLVINSGTVVVSSNLGHAGIGGAAGASDTGGAGGNGGSTTINGGNVTVWGSASGIGGGNGGTSTGPSADGGNGGNGGTTIINGGIVTVSGEYGAGIGGGEGGDSQNTPGGNGGNGGTTTIAGGEVFSTGYAGAGIGGGGGGITLGWTIAGSGGNGGTVNITGGQVEVEGRSGAGIGGGQGGGAQVGIGGYGGDGGTVTVDEALLTAAADSGAGIGGGDGGFAPPPESDGHHRGLGGDASLVSIGASASVEVSRNDASKAAAAIGPGDGVAWGNGRPMTLDGELTLPEGQHLWTRTASQFTAASPVTGTGIITGAGTIQNDGIITPRVHDDVTVRGNDHYVTFDSGTSQVDPRTQVVRVLAPTFDEGARSFPADPSITGNPFLGWNTNADDSGTVPTPTTALSGHPTFYGQWTHDTYVLAPDVSAPHVGDPVTFEVEVEDGDPAGDQSGNFTFSTDAPGITFVGNEVTFTKPGTWTVTATQKTVPTIVLTAPITVTSDRTAAATIALSVSATTIDAGGTITATVTGADAYGNPLGDLTDLAAIGSDETGDTVTQGSLGTPASIHFATPGTRTVTASIGSVTDTVDVTVTAEEYTMIADVTSPLAGDVITFSITADDGDPSGDLASDFTFATTGPGTTVTGNPITLTTAGDWTVTATHTVSGTQVTLPLTVGTDRTDPAAITVTLDATSVTVGDTVTAAVTGTDTYGNPLGDLTDLAAITSSLASDVIGVDGSFDVLVPGTRVISAEIGGITDTASLGVTPTSAYYTLSPDVTSPLAGTTVTYTIAAGNGIPAGDLSSEFTLTTDSAAATISGNTITFVTAANATVTATHNSYGTVLTLPVTVMTDRTTPADITLNLSSTSVDVGGTLTFDITGADAWGNSLGDLTDLATITSDHPSDVISPSGSIRLPTASPHVITATIGSVSHSVTVRVIPAALPGGLAGTGGEPLPLVLAGALLLLLGGVFVARRQRRS